MGNAQRLVGATAAALALLIASPTFADPDKDPSPPEVTDKRRGKQLYELGKKLFAAKEFLEAAKTFLESYEFDPRPGALFNRGRCLEEGGDKPGAISSYKRYLAVEPDGDASDEARTRTLALERQIELEVRDEGKGAGVDGGESPPGQSLRYTGLATGGVGIAVFATGVVFGLKSRGISSDFDDRDPMAPWTDAEIDRFNEGERAEVIGVSLMVVGAAAVVGGGVLYYLGHRERGKKADNLEITPTVSPDGAGAQIRLRF